MLKKLIITLALVALAATAFAGGAVGVPAGITSFAPSNNVKVAYAGGTGGGAGTVNVVYAISSKNTAGDRLFGTTSATTVVGYKADAAGWENDGSKDPGVPGTPSDSSLAGFSAL